MDRSERVIRLAWTAAAVIAASLGGLPVGAFLLLALGGGLDVHEDKTDWGVLTLEQTLDDLEAEESLAADEQPWPDEALALDEESALGDELAPEDAHDARAQAIGEEPRDGGADRAAPGQEEDPPEVVMGGVPFETEADDSPSEDGAVPRAAVRDLLAEPEGSPLDLSIETEDGPIRLDEEALGADLWDPDFESEELPPVPWYLTARDVASIALGLVLGALLLLLGRLERDLRVGLAGGLLCLAYAGAAIGFVVWLADLDLPEVWAFEWPFVLVASGLVVLGARRRRCLLLGLLVAGHAASLLPRELLLETAFRFELPLLVTGVGLAASFALPWCAVAAAFVGHARARRGDRAASVGRGPYRSSEPSDARAQGGAWAPRAVLRVAWTWLFGLGAVRAAFALGLLQELQWGALSFAGDLALAIAATLAARRARKARKAFVVASAFFYAGPVAILGEGLHRATTDSCSDTPLMLGPVESSVHAVLHTACFVAGVAATLTAVRTEVGARANDAHAAASRGGTILVLLGAAAAPWVVSFDVVWIDTCCAWQLAISLVLAAALALRRPVLHLTSLQPEQSAAEPADE